MEKHPYAELIKQVVDGLAVPQFKNAVGWYDDTLECLVIHSDWEWRAKPAEPEKVYPVTQMTESELDIVWDKYIDKKPTMFAIANAALRHEVDNGYLAIPTKDEAK